MEFSAGKYEDVALSALHRHSERLVELSQEIWSNPELAYKEYQAVALLTKYLEVEGFEVTRNFCDLETSFVAAYQSKDFDAKRDVTVGVLLEYDALPEMGHGCGHNLISEAGLGAFLAIAEVLKVAGFEGKVICMGTPAEEGGGGKVQLVRKGAFNNIDFAIMAHPAPLDILEPAILGVEVVTVEYQGVAAHASCAPWEGVNALDAAIAAYNNIALLRQQLKPGHQIHVNIVNGGVQPNIIPEYSKCVYNFRAPTLADMRVLKQKLIGCFEAAARATGCQVKYVFDENVYEPLMCNKTINSVYAHYGKKHGMFFPQMRPTYGSTDMGNVSVVVPSIHPAFAIPGMTIIHTKEFQVLAGQPMAHKAAQRCALALAMSALEIFASPEFRTKARQEFTDSLKSFVGSDHAQTLSGNFDK